MSTSKAGEPAVEPEAKNTQEGLTEERLDLITEFQLKSSDLTAVTNDVLQSYKRAKDGPPTWRNYCQARFDIALIQFRNHIYDLKRLTDRWEKEQNGNS